MSSNSPKVIPPTKEFKDMATIVRIDYVWVGPLRNFFLVFSDLVLSSESLKYFNELSGSYTIIKFNFT